MFDSQFLQGVPEGKIEPVLPVEKPNWDVEVQGEPVALFTQNGERLQFDMAAFLRRIDEAFKTCDDGTVEIVIPFHVLEVLFSVSDRSQHKTVEEVSEETGGAPEEILEQFCAVVAKTWAEKLRAVHYLDLEATVRSSDDPHEDGFMIELGVHKSGAKS